MNYYVTAIYFDFINFIKKDLLESYNRMKKILLKDDVIYKGYVFYDYDDEEGIAHMFRADENVMELFSEVKKNAKIDLKKEELILINAKKELVP